MGLGEWRTDATNDSIRVLQVDDDPAFGELVQTHLERVDDRIDVTTASSAEEALKSLEETRHDCVVSDYDMPETDGIELLEAIREEHTDLPFILFTGKGSEEIASTAITAGVTDYLQKQTGTEQYTVLANRIQNAVDRYRSERALAERKRGLETLISNLPGMVYRCKNEPAWPMEFASAQCEHLTGYSPASLEGGDVVWGEDIIHPDDKEQMWTVVQESLDDHDPFEVQFRIRTRDGTVKHVWERGRGIYDADGDLVALEGFITDITDQRTYERELERQNERLDEFTSIVSHDLRNPLNVAAGRLGLAREDCDSPHLEDIADAHDRMRALIDDLLELAREGELRTDFDRVRLASVADDCWATVESAATLDVAADCELRADSARLSQLLENLFRNAVEHGSTSNQNATRSGDAVEHGSTSPDSQTRQDAVEQGGTEVTVGSLAANEDDPAVTDGAPANGFYVADDGPGIPPSERDQVFVPGYSNSADGTGFGLTIVDRIAEAHGWTVTITESDSGGARFEFLGVESPAES